MEVVCEEKSFNYKFEKGILYASFTPLQTCRVKATIYRQTNISEEKQNILNEYRSHCNTYNVEIDMAHIRDILQTEYQELFYSANDEMKSLQIETSGSAVCSAIRTFLPPSGYEIVRGPPNIPNSDIEMFPYNFGVRIKKSHDNKGPLIFCCLANDICRQRKTSIQLNRQEPPPPKSRLIKSSPLTPDRDIVVSHLREKHWNVLIQTGFADHS